MDATPSPEVTVESNTAPTESTSTGPTGPESTSTGPTGPTGTTGPESTSTGPTGPYATTEFTYTEAELLAMTPSPEIPPSPYIITIDELKATQEALSHKETIDRARVFQFVEPDPEDLRRKLLGWAASGLPDGFQLNSISIEPPSKCTDGQIRPKFEYIEYLLGTTLYERLQHLQFKLPGMALSYSLPDSQVCLHVSKG